MLRSIDQLIPRGGISAAGSSMQERYECDDRMERCKFRFYRIAVRGLDTFMAATVGGGHIHAAASVLHLAAAAMLLCGHPGTRERARHRRSEERHEHAQRYRNLTPAAHPSLE
ncbi:MAG: hypothetical protein ACR2JB_08900 [Bryobacteraceae bacterium]